MKEDRKGMVRSTVYLPGKLHREFKALCIMNDISMSQALIVAIDTILKSNTSANVSFTV